MPYSSPMPGKGEGVPASQPCGPSSTLVHLPTEVSPKDRSVATMGGADLVLPVPQFGSLSLEERSSLPPTESSLPVSATSSSSPSHPLFAWPPPLTLGTMHSGRDPFDLTKSFSEDPFAHRSSESSSGASGDDPVSSLSSPVRPMPVPHVWPRTIPSTQTSTDSSVYSLDAPSLLPNPRPRQDSGFDPYHSLSLELAESLQSAIQNIVDVTPPHLSDVTKDQAASSIPIPAVSISTLLNTMRGLNYLAANFVPICEDQSNGVRIVQDFDLGTLIQSVADQLAPDFARADVELVLLPSGDSGHSASRVLGDRDGISFMLIHAVRQLLTVATKGDTIELSYHAALQPPHRFSDASFTSSPSASPAPAFPDLDVLCSFNIIHDIAELPDHNAVTPKAEIVNPFSLLGRAKPHPIFDSPLCTRLLRQVNASIKTEARPSSPSFGVLRRAYEVTLALPRGHSDTPMDLGDGSKGGGTPPTRADLAELIDTLHDKKAVVFASSTSIFARQLVDRLKRLGFEVSLNEGREPQASPKLTIIDDDVSVLRREVARLRPDSLSIRKSSKRSGLFRSTKSTSHLRPSIQAASIIHFTSVDKYRQVREVLPSLGTPDILVVPKPVGVGRLFATLYSALQSPLSNNTLAPTCSSSPRSPQISSGNLTPTGTTQEGFFHAVDMPADVTTPSAQSHRNGGEMGENPPLSSSLVTPLPIETPASEYFARPSRSTSNAAGVVIKSPGGRSQIWFQPPGSGKAASSPQQPGGRRTQEEDEEAPVSPTGSPSSRRPSAISTSTDDSMTAEEQGLPVLPPATRHKGPEAKSVPTRQRSSTVTRQAEGRRDKSVPETSKSVTRPAAKSDVVVPPINVLIVEDNPINQNILSMFFRKKKIRHQTAKDGLEAVEKWRTGGFHLILMDIQLPVMDGIEATKEIRKLERSNNIGVFPSTPLGDNQPPIEMPASSPFRSSVIIVALTASSLQTDRVAALAAGCNDFLTKPVSLKWLEKKTVEWGCMQALIDFEGWRRWKGSEGADPSETKRGFQTGPEAAAHKVATALRLDPNKSKRKKDEGKLPLPA